MCKMEKYDYYFFNRQLIAPNASSHSIALNISLSLSMCNQTKNCLSSTSDGSRFFGPEKRAQHLHNQCGVVFAINLDKVNINILAFDTN